jgi:hypothetical protein
VTVRFDGRDGDTHEIVLDPTTEKVINQHTPASGVPMPAPPSSPTPPDQGTVPPAV